jgi:hypothetical protein
MTIGNDFERPTDDPSLPAAMLRLARGTHPGTVVTEVYFDPDTSATLATRRLSTEAGSTLADTRIYTPPRVTRSLTRP